MRNLSVVKHLEDLGDTSMELVISTQNGCKFKAVGTRSNHFNLFAEIEDPETLEIRWADVGSLYDWDIDRLISFLTVLKYQLPTPAEEE